jgi:hypothetical protein
MNRTGQDTQISKVYTTGVAVLLYISMRKDVQKKRSCSVPCLVHTIPRQLVNAPLPFAHPPILKADLLCENMSMKSILQLL